MSSSSSPYPPETWRKIRSCGEQVENLLKQTDMALTMGGEPTFIPLVPEGAEWNTAALGPTKLDYARRFARQLAQGYFPGAAVLETTGKHYPGEPLPRWALLLQWRNDGRPLWRNITRLRGNTKPGKHTVSDSKKLIDALSVALTVSSDNILPLVEAAAAGSVSGYVLPLDHDGKKWISDDWASALKKREAMLFSGDSLVGLRLPLASLGKKNLLRALTVEVRDGGIVVFIPPLTLEAYLLLLPAIENCLEQLNLEGCALAGYAPPTDARLNTIGFASDPGVIEVNLAICATWSDYDQQLDRLYQSAKKAGLCGSKLHLNGRETGTGGGAHIVFGGPLGLASPFFAFPTFLPSVIRYFQHHPALSYAFTGQYMGPSSQAPRIDESTFEALYELEIACAGAEQIGTPANLALFDLLFRDLLMDRTGNTHRAEISVDKLWNPFAGNGRLGLVEFRAFETSPSAAALSVTGLLIRAVLARLAVDPFKSPFVRWSGELHDRFFLPAFVWQDLMAICADLRAHGIPFDPEWLRPLWEFRFPRLGRLTAPGGGTIQFRQALEAWPLLGEQPNGGGTSRCVDASMDRIEASVEDATVIEKGLLLVNGLPCVFRSVESPVKGAAAASAGIRFRAFFLNPALHPHIPVHAPLLIEWVDKITLTVAAAARWHVWNPRSEPYSSRPKEKTEAETRFKERWEPWPHTVGQPRFISKIDFPPEGRHTLDLRRYPAQAR